MLPEAGFDKGPKSLPPHQQLPFLPAQVPRSLAILSGCPGA